MSSDFDLSLGLAEVAAKIRWSFYQSCPEMQDAGCRIQGRVGVEEGGKKTVKEFRQYCLTSRLYVSPPPTPFPPLYVLSRPFFIVFLALPCGRPFLFYFWACFEEGPYSLPSYIQKGWLPCEKKRKKKMEEKKIWKNRGKINAHKMVRLQSVLLEDKRGKRCCFFFCSFDNHPIRGQGVLYTKVARRLNEFQRYRCSSSSTQRNLFKKNLRWGCSRSQKRFTKNIPPQKCITKDSS